MERFEKAVKLFSILEDDYVTKNFIAQANARYILFGVNESTANFPRFRPNLNEGLDLIAYSYLSIGCYFAEYQQIDEAINPLKKAGTIIEHNHFSKQNRNKLSDYHILIGALAYYASCQYSKAFVLLKRNQYKKTIAILISDFLCKKYNQLSDQIDNILLDTDFASQKYNQVYTILLARSLSMLLLYLQIGDKNHLNACIEILDDAIELSIIDEDPSLWWIFRLVKIIANGFYNSSLWANLNPLKEGIDINIDIDYQLRFRDSPLFSWLVPERSETVNDFIGNFVFRDKNPVVELFLSQRQALEKILDPLGAVVSLPTSSGKTRIAEIAIFQSLLDNPFSQILYLAPFRSLAFEIEETLSQTFVPLGYTVTHLYGGAQFTSIDKTLIDNANILIATPEKAKAIIRANDELASRVALVIIDEGHLLGKEKRFVTNEMFIEELRFLMKKNEGKIILLSAVLPNTTEISQWIANSDNQIVKSDWRPSSQRFGILEFTGTSVNLEWEGEEKSYNYDFIEDAIDKKKAIAQTAIKLSSLGSTLIYVGRANMVMTQAKEIYDFLDLSGEVDLDWNEDYEWERFELACIENENNNNVLKYARKGIMCHSNTLSSEVRLGMERLLRKSKVRFIVSTSTLAQGVNLGVSTVIFANVFITKEAISKRDFWNIAGRAGRAFVDTEGKILYVIDRTNLKANWHRSLAKDFFNHSNLESALSGIYSKIIEVKKIALDCGVDFEHLLELILENNFSQLPTEKEHIDSIRDFLDWIDDSLLSLNLANDSFKLDESGWIDDHFRRSLAFIQSKESGEDVINFLKARSNAVKQIAGDPSNWKSFASSGIPLLSISKIDEMMDEISSIVSTFLDSQKELEDRINFLRNIEAIINSLPSSSFDQKFDLNEIENVRSVWLSGNTLKGIKNANEISNQYFAFTLPWVINAISKKFRLIEKEDEAIAFEELGILCELGLPSFWAAKIYLAGIRSRNAAKELSLIFREDLVIENLSEIADVIIRNYDNIKGRSDCSENTLHWIKIISKQQTPTKKDLAQISNFKFGIDSKIDCKILYCKSFNDLFYLCSPDYKEKVEVKVTEKLPFDKIANIPGVYFEKEDQIWKMKNRNPHYRLN